MATKVREVSTVDLEEYAFAVQQGEALNRVLVFLRDYGAEEVPLDAVLQAIQDNANYLDDSLTVVGSA